MQQTEIITDETMRELCKHGTPDFPFAYYDENLRQFQRGCIDWHWHRELEWVFVDSGVVVCKAEGAQECLYAGDAILFNSRTIHRPTFCFPRNSLRRRTAQFTGNLWPRRQDPVCGLRCSAKPTIGTGRSYARCRRY